MQRARLRWLVLAFACVAGTACQRAPEATPGAPTPSAIPASRGGAEYVGRVAQAWDDVAWVDGSGPTLASLRGKVVLVRWWTDTCPFCRATAPALAELDRTYRDRGLVVVGMYHPKPKGTQRTAGEVAEVARTFGWDFPIALDLDWSLLDAYWPTGAGGTARSFTSVSFLIDRRGVIRFVHPGPEFHRAGAGDDPGPGRDFDDITRAVESLLGEDAF